MAQSMQTRKQLLRAWLPCQRSLLCLGLLLRLAKTLPETLPEIARRPQPLPSAGTRLLRATLLGRIIIMLRLLLLEQKKTKHPAVRAKTESGILLYYANH